MCGVEPGPITMTQPLSSTRIPATLIPGDGIGPEITDATVKVLEAAEIPRKEWQRTLTIASIVEGEVNGDADRAKVASSNAQLGEAVFQISRAKSCVLAAYPSRPRSVAK